MSTTYLQLQTTTYDLEIVAVPFKLLVFSLSTSLPEQPIMHPPPKKNPGSAPDVAGG